MIHTTLRGILPPKLRGMISDEFMGQAQEIRLRLGKNVLITSVTGLRTIRYTVTSEDLTFCVNAASRYSPWNATSIKHGYLTASGGHRIGICGEGAREGLRNLTSLNIRVAKDITGIADPIRIRESTLILGPPGSGKTTLLRDLIRKISQDCVISVVDERCELFPQGFETGANTDILSGCDKPRGIDMVLRSMGPEWIAVDEITNPADCAALVQAGWCGVKLLATAHAASVQDLVSRPVYRPLVETKLFSSAVVLRPDKTWYMERICI